MQNRFAQAFQTIERVAVCGDVKLNCELGADIGYIRIKLLEQLHEDRQADVHDVDLAFGRLAHARRKHGTEVFAPRRE